MMRKLITAAVVAMFALLPATTLAASPKTVKLESSPKVTKVSKPNKEKKSSKHHHHNHKQDKASK